jgi:transposase
MKMKLNNGKLKKNTQLRLLKYFVLEVTARSAANLLDIHPNTAALFSKKIRQIMSYHLALQASEVLDGCIEPDES